VPARPALPLDESAGPVAVLGAAARLLPALPGVVGGYVLLALVTLVSRDAANLLSLPVNAYAVTAAYRELGGDPADGNSFGVRLVVAFVAGLVTGIAVLVGFVVLVVPGVYLLVRLRLVLAALRGALRVGGAVSTVVADPVSVTANAVLFALYEDGTGGTRPPATA